MKYGSIFIIMIGLYSSDSLATSCSEAIDQLIKKPKVKNEVSFPIECQYKLYKDLSVEQRKQIDALFKKNKISPLSDNSKASEIFQVFLADTGKNSSLDQNQSTLSTIHECDPENNTSFKKCSPGYVGVISNVLWAGTDHPGHEQIDCENRIKTNSFDNKSGSYTCKERTTKTHSDNIKAELAK